MTEEKNKQISFFDYEEFKESEAETIEGLPAKEQDFKKNNPEAFEEWNKHLRNQIEALTHYTLYKNEENEQDQKNRTDFLTDIRTSMYKQERFYSFSKASGVIQFLIKKELEGFKNIYHLIALMNLTFNDLQKDISSICGPEDLFKKHLKEYEELFEENKEQAFKYLDIIDHEFETIQIYKFEDKQKLISLIQELKYKNEGLDFLKGLKEETFNKLIQESNQGIKELYKDTKEESLKYYEELINNKFDEIEAYLKGFGNTFKNRTELSSKCKSLEEKIHNLELFTDNTYFDRNSKNFELSFRDMDYLEALRLLKAGSQKNDPEGLILIEAFKEGLNICGNSILYNEEDQEQETRSEEYQEEKDNKLKLFYQLLEKEQDPERKEEIQKLISLENADTPFIDYAKNLKVNKKLLLNSNLSKASFKEVNFKVNEFNEIEVNYNFDLLDKKGNFLTEEYKPIVNAVLSWYEINGKTPFSLIQLYEIYYNKPYRNQSAQNKKNLDELEKALDEMRLLTMRIKFKEEYTSIDDTTGEEIKETKDYKFFNYFLPMKKVSIRTTKKYISHGRETEISNDSYYQIIDTPPIYAYSKHFDLIEGASGTILNYEPKEYLKGLKSLPSNSENQLIIENLLHRIILMKQRKLDTNKINYENFFEDYCRIDYSLLTKKSRETYRNKLKLILNGFIQDKIISNYKEYSLKENAKVKAGIEIYF